MEVKNKSQEQLREILLHLEPFSTEELAPSEALLTHLHNALDVFTCLTNRGYTENQSDHIINYCRTRMEYSLRQIEGGGLEEGLPLARSVIAYYLKEVTTPADA